ncbi:peptide transporter, partial [Haloquadratum walsbyi]|uniref:peptide transporter n=1 Tax=Haloquadratum walsbyi TaxID=293091 RepID=UPI0023F2BBB6
YAENTELATDGSRSDVSETVSNGDGGRRHLSDRIDTSVSQVIESVSISRNHLLRVIGVLALVVMFRLSIISNVFQQEYIILPGNDPYSYRHTLLNFAKTAQNPFIVATEQGEPLFMFTLQLITTLFGGSSAAAEQVLVWYPVVAAVICGISVYLIGTRLTDDRRVGLASVAILATLPAHAYRTSIGFADHHAFDMVILAIVLAAVTAHERTSPTSVSEISELTPWIVIAGIGIGAHTLAWEAGALLIIPLGVYGFIRALTSIYRDVSVIYRLAPLTTSVVIGGVTAVLGHTILGWQSATMIIPPTLLAVALSVMMITAEGLRRSGLGYRVTALTLVLSGVVVLLGTIEVIPGFNDEFREQASRLFTSENIFEAQSLFSIDLGFILAPIYFFGLAIFISMIVFMWGSWVGWRRDRGDLLVVCAYGITFFLLSSLQVRFAGHLALPVAILTGISFVWFTAKITEITPPTVRPTGVSAQSATEQRAAWRRHSTDTNSDSTGQDRNTTDEVSRRYVYTTVVVLFLLIGGIGAGITPLQANTLAFSDDTGKAIDKMNTFSTVENRSWPETYVFSRWGNSRGYNAYLNDRSTGYGYARSNYIDFLRSDESEEWYQQIQGR